jgi:hypothetical protein
MAGAASPHSSLLVAGLCNNLSAWYFNFSHPPAYERSPMDKIAIISLFLIFFSVLTITLGIVKLHTYPGKVAEQRGHPQKEAIEATSLMGLLIFPLWMVALVWSYSGAVIGTLYEPPADGEPDESDLENTPVDGQ